MIGAVPVGFRLLQLSAAAKLRRFEEAVRGASPPLLFGLRLWASVSLALYAAYWLELDDPFWAGTSAAIVCQPQLGASLRKGWFRAIGTLVGAVVSVVLAACFSEDRLLFLVGLALWGAACAFFATILRNFASYAAALAGYTVAIVAGDLLGATGGIDANAAFLLAVARATEIGLGIVCAGMVLAATDLGTGRRDLATRFADLLAGITAGFTDTLAGAGGELVDSQSIRREFIRRVAALDPVIDQTLGESSQIRYYSPVLQNAVAGLFTALTAWRAVANHAARRIGDEIQIQAGTVLETVPQELLSALRPSVSARWVGDPVALRRLCEIAVRRLLALPAATPSLRLLADNTAEAFHGISQALNGLALLADPAQPIPHRGSKHLRVPDRLPALINAGRAFVTIAAIALFWIITGWPGGAGVITFAAIVVILLAPRAEQAYGAALLFTVGATLDLVLTAIVKFAVLPSLGTETFAGLSLVIALCLVPVGALLAQARQPWQVGLFTGMTMQFMPLLQPTNPMNFDILLFYNTGLAIVSGATLGAISFRLFPAPSPSSSARRLLTLTLRDLRHLATGRAPSDWEGMMHGRLLAMPNEATPLQRARLLAALSVGREIIHLRESAYSLDPRLRRDELFDAPLDAILAALAHGNSAIAIAHLTRLDEMLGAANAKPVAQTALRARASILVLSETLMEHAAYFEDGAAE